MTELLILYGLVPSFMVALFGFSLSVTHHATNKRLDPGWLLMIAIAGWCLYTLSLLVGAWANGALDRALWVLLVLSVSLLVLLFPGIYIGKKIGGYLFWRSKNRKRPVVRVLEETLEDLRKEEKYMVGAKMVLHHDDPPCRARLYNGFCYECNLVPDMQSTCFLFFCPSCDCHLKNFKCPKCGQIFERPTR